MKLVTNNMVIDINEMYLKGKSIKSIANTMNISPYTVKKYIKNLEENKIEKNIFNRPLPKFNTKIFREKDWGELCLLSEEEMEEVRKLWEEIEF